ncbi:MAG: DUF72 domain-containing protein [Acidobacteriota bacterium]
MPGSAYRLGLPMWGFDAWRGGLYRARSKPRDFLAQYAEVFDTVEGNTTFYSLPSETAVDAWRAATPESFRFCFKLPRTVTHERALQGAGTETSALLHRLAPLGPRLGPYLVQLPPAFAPEHLDLLDRYLTQWPQALRVAVEVRHRAFFTHPEAGARLDDLLLARGAARVVMHTAAMRSGDLEHPDILGARHEKPDLPIDPRVIETSPVETLVRFVGHPDDAPNAPFLDIWADVLAAWIGGGRRPFFFVHSPSNVDAPALARRFHKRLAERVGSTDVDADLPPWPGETPAAGEQLTLL